VNLDTKQRNGGKVEGLEEICSGCTGECKSKKCNGGYISITEVHHFEVFNKMHPLNRKEPIQNNTSSDNMAV